MRGDVLELVPAGWRVPQSSRLSELQQRCREDGYVITGGELEERWLRHRMYPIVLSSAVDADAAVLLAAWHASSRTRFDPAELPWLPICTVGPLLVLGHVDLGIKAPPLPWGTFQPVCLRLEDYERHLANVSLLMDGRAQAEGAWNFARGGGVGRFPETLVLPTDRDNGLTFLREYFLHRETDFRVLEKLCRSQSMELSDLPAGYHAALHFLVQSGGVVQPQNIRLSEPLQRKLPEALRRRVTVISEVGRQLWCAAPVLPQAEAEDRLYAELDEGSIIHWLLLAPDQPSNPKETGQPAVMVPQASSKIVLSSVSGAPRGGGADVVEAEERLIMLEEKDWARFDPRHRDAGEPESLWKWAVYKSLIDGSTDLHIEPGPATTRVRQRIDGLLEEILEVPSTVGEAMVYSLMTQVGLGSDKYRPLDGSFQVEIIAKVSSRHQTVRVRANAYPLRGVTQKIALRFLPRQGAVPTFEALMPAKPARYFSRAISRPEGLILVCGPTGSGKTTTIFSALSVLNRPDVNVTTLENPVEILLEGTNQAEINPRRDVTWASLNRAFLRQDPDVGLIGEIRDEDTAKTILRAALTGHLVFGSLHTKSCPTSVLRMADLGAEPNMLAESLILVECQRLVRRVCPHCRKERPLSEREQALFGKHQLPAPSVLYGPSESTPRCEYCRGRGYRGRAAAVEVLPNVPAVRRMIEERSVSQAYAEWMRAHSLPTVFENALELAAAGITSLEEALTLQDAWDGEEWTHLL